MKTVAVVELCNLGLGASVCDLSDIASPALFLAQAILCLLEYRHRKKIRAWKCDDIIQVWHQMCTHPETAEF